MLQVNYSIFIERTRANVTGKLFIERTRANVTGKLFNIHRENKS